MEKLRFRISLRFKLAIAIIAVLISTTVLTGYVSYKKSAQTLEEEFGRKTMAIAKTGALLIDGDQHSKLKKIQDEKTDTYKKIASMLTKIKDENGAAYAYTLVLNGYRKTAFVVDADAVKGNDFSHIGDECQFDTEMQSAFDGKASFNKELVTDQWGTFKSGFAPIKNSKGQVVAILGVDYSAASVLVDEKELLRNYFYMGGIIILLGIIFSIFLSANITRPIKKMVKTITDIANMEADLTQQLKINSRDELGDMAAQFNKMLSKLGDLIRHIRVNTNELSATSTEMAESSNYALNATNDIVDAIKETVNAVEVGSANQQRSVEEAITVMEQFDSSIHQLASGATEQANQITKTSQYVGQIASEIEQVAANSVTVAESSSMTTAAAHKGTEVINDTVEGMKVITGIVGEAEKTIKELGNRSQQIGEIIAVIDEIADQTNLLALNAAIEAARAGENGKGFAVVADEVRKLAERSSKSTKEIEDLISHIAKGISDSVSSMKLVTARVNDGFIKATEAGKVLNGILDFANNTNEQMQLINESTKSISDKSKNMVEAIDAVASIIEENSASANEMAEDSNNVKEMVEKIGYVSSESSQAVKEVGASGENMRNVVNNIAQSSKTLAEMAEGLETLTSQFKID